MTLLRKLSAIAATAAVAIGVAPVAHAEPAPVITPVVLGELAHDPSAFTEGFELAGAGPAAVLYEGTGLAGSSQLRELDPATGTLRRAADVPGGYFGEGVTVVGDRLWQLTYDEGKAVLWDRATLKPIREVPISGQGWGLCYDGTRLIRGDGSARLRFQSPTDLSETGGVDVTRDGQPVTGLNELECVAGEVWANVWPTDTLVRIDPDTGKVNLVVDASGLRTRGIPPDAQVLNGIAHVSGDQFLLTGKDWPKTFRVELGLR